MKRIAMITLMILLAIAPVAACSSVPASASQSPLPSGYVKPFVDEQYEEIPQVNPGSAKEIKVAVPDDMEMPKVLAYPNGSVLLLGDMVEYRGIGGGLGEFHTMTAIRYNAAGKMAWTKTFYEQYDGVPLDAKPLPDGGFVFTFSTQVVYNNGENTANVQFIVFCDVKGNILQNYYYGQLGIYQYLCITDIGEVYAVGQAYFKDGKLVGSTAAADGDSDICIQKYDQSGKLLFCRKFGGSGYDNPTAVAWLKDNGLVLAVNVEKADEDISPPSSFTLPADDHATLLAAFDDNGGIKWQFFDSDQNKLYFESLLQTNGGTLAEGYRGGKSFFVKVNSDGTIAWEISPDGAGDYSVLCTAALADGGFAAAINRYDDTDPDRGEYLAMYDQNGKVLNRVKLPNEMLRSIMPTQDGGLLTVGTQNVSALPQPAYVNSIWYDTETIATKYGVDLTIQWRKVYDRYVNMTKQDIVVPLSNGEVIVER